MYDFKTGTIRPIEQADMDEWTDIRAAYGMLVEGMNALLDAAKDVAQGRRDYVDVAARIRERR